jgi:LuxR family maltose regulon positive regulatory protein
VASPTGSYSFRAVATNTSERDELDRSAAPGPLVLETKLTRPPVRAEYVARSELVESLREGTARALTLVTAPPGFGKTTLLAAWSAASERVAWLSLDQNDNDPARFFVHLVTALRTVEPGLGAEALAAQAAPGAEAFDFVLPLLLNELAALEQSVVLVLDDYHLITNAHIQEGMTYLVERLPASLRLVLATREDPPLPLARLRARAHLTELRARELRFSDAETSSFLNDMLGLGLAAQDVELLQARTEGWPAALYLAALTLRGQADPGKVIAAFAGDDRHIVDYLTGEVLAQQTPEMRSFLLRTSVLSRLCGPLCDAVTEMEGSAEILGELERSNLLLVPLDDKRIWYRYHQLFAELLQHELRRTDAEALPGLHRRASAWYRDAGLIVEAADHATAAGDTDAAVELVGRHWSLFLEHGQLATVSRWLDALPANAIAENRMLCFAGAMVTSHLGRLDEAEHWLERAARRSSKGEEDELPVEALRAWLRLLHGDIEGTIEAAHRSIAREPAGSVPAKLMLGSALWWSQRLTEARPLLEAASREAEAARLTAVRVALLSLRAAIEFDADDAAHAETLTHEARELMSLAKLEQHPSSAMAHIVIGKTHVRHGEFADAAEQIERGIKLAERVGAWHISTYGVLALAEIRHREREPAETRRLLARARTSVDALPDGGPGLLARLEQTERTLRVRPVRRRDAGAAAFWELSERELAVLRLLPSKLSQREIAAELYVSFNTVKTHTRAIFRKLGVATRAEAVSRAHELGLL